MHTTDRATSIRNAVFSAAFATGCMLEPDVSRPGAAVLRLCAQAPNRTVAQLFAGRVREEIGASVEIAAASFGTYDCNIAVEI